MAFMPGHNKGSVGNKLNLWRVRQDVIVRMGGCAAEMSLLGNEPPKYIATDVPNAAYFARMVCSTHDSVVAFLEFCYQESLALVEQYKPVVAALAQRCSIIRSARSTAPRSMR